MFVQNVDDPVIQWNEKNSFTKKKNNMLDKILDTMIWLKSKQMVLMIVPFLITVFCWCCVLIADMCLPMHHLFFKLVEIALFFNVFAGVIPIVIYEFKA